MIGCKLSAQTSLLLNPNPTPPRPAASRANVVLIPFATRFFTHRELKLLREALLVAAHGSCQATVSVSENVPPTLLHRR